MPLYTEMSQLLAQVKIKRFSATLYKHDVKWLRIMCDYSAEGVWNHRGAATSLAAYPISDALAARILAWQNWYECMLGDLTGAARWNDFFGMDFSEAGRMLAQAVKQELPDWTVVYFDDARCNEVYEQGLDRTDPKVRALYEYEIEGQPK